MWLSQKWELGVSLDIFMPDRTKPVSKSLDLRQKHTDESLTISIFNKVNVNKLALNKVAAISASMILCSVSFVHVNTTQERIIGFLLAGN